MAVAQREARSSPGGRVNPPAGAEGLRWCGLKARLLGCPRLRHHWARKQEQQALGTLSSPW